MAELTQVARAIQKQVNEHVSPVWKIHAEVDPFAKSAAVPAGYWHATIRDHIQPEGAWSIHSVANGQPFAEVTFGKDWTLGASHDVIEMLIDPNVSRLAKAPSIRAGDRHNVEYLVQACDPCAASSYDIDGVKVADFSLPRFWSAKPGLKGKYSFTGVLTEPRQIVRGGYLSWRDPRTRHYWQKVWWEDEPAYNDLGSYVDETPRQSRQQGKAPPSERELPTELTALREVVLAQGPAIRLARTSVEELIKRFGHQRAGN
jgi:hypothetical protein